MSSQQDHVRRTQALEAQVGRLNAKLETLTGRFESLSSPLTLGQIPSYEVVRIQPASALTGSDWDDFFNDQTQPNRITHLLRTASGEISHINSDDSATRLRIRFTGQGKGQITLKLGISGSGSVQVKSNGSITPYSTGAFIQISVVPPPLTNELIIMGDGTGGTLQFTLDGLLFDGVNRRWISY